MQHSENTNDGNAPPALLAEQQHPASRSAGQIHTTDYIRPNLPAVRTLYAIIDSITDTIIGGIQIHLNDASAMRTLFDIATGDTAVHKHPLDYDLWRLGTLTPDHQVRPEKTRIVTGFQIKEMISPEER